MKNNYIDYAVTRAHIDYLALNPAAAAASPAQAQALDIHIERSTINNISRCKELKKKAEDYNARKDESWR